MGEQEWRQTGVRESELEEVRPVTVAVDGRQVLLLRAEGRLQACGAECSHYKGPLAEGRVSGHTVTCPWHNARFDVRDGRLLSPPALNDLAAYELKVEGGEVWLRRRGEPRIEMPADSDGRTFLIAGAGAAGNAAAEALRREGFGGRIVLITAEATGPYDRTMLSKDYLSGEAPAKWLPLRGEKFYARLQIELRTGSRIASLDPRSRTLVFADGTRLQGDRILLATGSSALRPQVPGVERPGCFTLRSLKDADDMLKVLPAARTVVVLGAGFLGLEAASSLRKRGLEVHLVATQELPLVRVFGVEIGRRLKRLHEKAGVVFHLGTGLAALEGEGGKNGEGPVQAALLVDGTRLPADAVLLAVGVRPAVEYLAGSGLADVGAVPVDSRQATAAEGIFAAGDIALLKDPAGGAPRRIEHWVEAERQGWHAARGMLGRSPLPREAPFFWTRQHGQSLQYVGYAPGWERVVFRGDPEGEDFLAGYYSAGVLRAAAAVGRPRELARIGELLEAGRSVGAAELADPAFGL